MAKKCYLVYTADNGLDTPTHYYNFFYNVGQCRRDQNTFHALDASVGSVYFDDALHAIGMLFPSFVR